MPSSGQIAELHLKIILLQLSYERDSLFKPGHQCHALLGSPFVRQHDIHCKMQLQEARLPVFSLVAILKRGGCRKCFMTWCCVGVKSFLACLQEAQREGGAKGRRGFFEILKGGFVRKKPEMADHGERDLLQGNTRYRKLQDLNEGTFGVVMLALDTHAREQVAIKFLERGAGEPSVNGPPPAQHRALFPKCTFLGQLPHCQKLTKI